MRVLHLVWNLIRGGTEGQCARVAMELARRGDTHRVVVFRREGFFLPAVEQACGPVTEIGIHGMLRRSTLTAVRKLADDIRGKGIDLLHTWDADAAIFGQFVAARAEVPLITSRRDLGEIYPPHKQWLMKRADRRARAVVVNAEAIRTALRPSSVPEATWRVIPNILDADEFDRLAAQACPDAGRLPEGRRVVMVARLDPEKDAATFLRAAAIVRDRVPDVSFVIAGDGVERTSLESLAATSGLASRIAFLGDVTDVPSLLRHCVLGALTPSRNEGLSNTILEYMAAGLPVVATDCGGNRELVAPPAGGVITAVGDAGGMADAIFALLHDPEAARKAGERNRSTVLQCHQPEAIGNQFQHLYQDVLREAGEGRQRQKH